MFSLVAFNTDIWKENLAILFWPADISSIYWCIQVKKGIVCVMMYENKSYTCLLMETYIYRSDANLMLSKSNINLSYLPIKGTNLE